MSIKQVNEITCDLCLGTSITTENEGSFIKGNSSLLFSYQGVVICDRCCFVIHRSTTLSEDFIRNLFARNLKDIEIQKEQQ